MTKTINKHDLFGERRIGVTSLSGGLTRSHMADLNDPRSGNRLCSTVTDQTLVPGLGGLGDQKAWDQI